MVCIVECSQAEETITLILQMLLTIPLGLGGHRLVFSVMGTNSRVMSHSKTQKQVDFAVYL